MKNYDKIKIKIKDKGEKNYYMDVSGRLCSIHPLLEVIV